jgi:hypothetical protein
MIRTKSLLISLIGIILLAVFLACSIPAQPNNDISEDDALTLSVLNKEIKEYEWSIQKCYQSGELDKAKIFYDFLTGDYMYKLKIYQKYTYKK